MVENSRNVRLETMGGVHALGVAANGRRVCCRQTLGS